MDFKEFLLGNKDMILSTNEQDYDNETINELIREWDSDIKSETPDAAIE